jgi:RNA polymerase sigma factor (sigma-70 family)
MIEAQPGDDTLVHRASQAFSSYVAGDRAAFDELVSLLTPLLWHTVRAQGVDRLAAEDVVQTIWMRLLHSSGSIRDPQTVVKWLLTAARREAWRVTKRARADMIRTAALFGQEGDELTTIPAQPEDLPEERVFRDDRQTRLWHHVQTLPERCRELMRVIAFADRPDYALIAESLGMPVGSIGPTRGRCLAKLRMALAADAHWDAGDIVSGDPSGDPLRTYTRKDGESHG